MEWTKLSASLPLKTVDGEVSLGVAETNELRAKLGLKPLKNVSDESERNYARARAAEAEARRLSEIEAELARARRKREAEAKPGPSLGEETESTAEWVERSRKVRELEAERRDKLLTEQETLRVASHSANLGTGAILTLRDEPILEYDGGRIVGLKAADDALQDVGAAEESRRKANIARSKGLAPMDEDVELGDAPPDMAADGAGESLARSFVSQREYMTADEARKLFKKKEKKVKTRVKTWDVDETTDADRGSRKGPTAAVRRAKEAASEQADKQRSFKLAKAKAQAQVDAAFDDDAELRASLAKARVYSAKREDPALKVANTLPKHEPPTHEPAGLVFTDTTEFASRLGTRDDDDYAAAKVLSTAADDDEEGIFRDDDGAAHQDEEIDFLHNQPLASNGMVAAMALLKTSGDIHEQRGAADGELMVGRPRDQRDFDDEHEDQTDVTFKGQLKPVKLEYRDAQGRLLTRKEAYRQMCWKFHGKAPGKKKQEKALHRYEEAQRSVKQSVAAGALSILQHAQQRSGQAYIPINNNPTTLGGSLGAALGDTKSKRSASSAAHASKRHKRTS